MAISPRIAIDASRSEVEQLLKDSVTDAQRANLIVSEVPPARNPLRPERQGEYETVHMVIDFAATTIASGVVYDLIKLVVKAAVDRFGKDRVK